MNATDTGYAPDRWAFDDEVTRVFDDMLSRSIPQYHTMREIVFDLACEFQQEHSAIVDLGCSRGEAIAPLVDRFGARCKFVGVEMSPPMLKAARERFRGYIDCGVVEIRELDLRRDYPMAPASVTLCVLTLVFVSINHRQRILRRAYEQMVDGGAFILVEKILGATSQLDDLMVDRYHAMKQRNGYTADEVERKRLALEGVQVPVKASWNVDMLRSAGFRDVDCVWRWHNFAAWVAIK